MNVVYHIDGDSYDDNLRIIVDDVVKFFRQRGFDPGGTFCVENDVTRECPIFCSVENNFGKFDIDTIILNVSKFSFWCQVIFQFSHEYAHYLIHCQNRHVESVSWIEESICEAISRLLLRWYYKNWDESDLSKINPNFGISVKKYLDKELMKKGTGTLSNCFGVEGLCEINEKAESCRALRYEEVKILVTKINSPDDIAALFKYRNYICDGHLLLDVDKYLLDYGDSKAVQYLCQLQSNALSRSVTSDV